MPLLQVVLLALALAVDAFVVSITGAAASDRTRASLTLRTAATFGAFQTLAPLVGWYAGRRLQDVVAAWDHWVAFALLAGVGLKMIHEALRPPGERSLLDPRDLRVVLLLAVATSIDAVAAGFTLSIVGDEIVRPALVLGAGTFLASYVGGSAGGFVGRAAKSRLALAGGLVLIALGTKIVLEHTVLA